MERRRDGSRGARRWPWLALVVSVSVVGASVVALAQVTQEGSGSDPGIQVTVRTMSVERGDRASVEIAVVEASKCTLTTAAPDSGRSRDYRLRLKGYPSVATWRVPKKAAKGLWGLQASCAGREDAAALEVTGRRRDGTSLISKGSLKVKRGRASDSPVHDELPVDPPGESPEEWSTEPRGDFGGVGPRFEIPFRCGEMWRAATYTNHSFNGNHFPLDFNHDNPSFEASAPVVASAGGVVAVSKDGDNDGYGSYVVIDHGGGWTSLYAHLANRAVGVGAAIAQGDPVGIVGASGSGSNGFVHLHYEQRRGGVHQHVRFSGQMIGYSFTYNGPAYTSANCGARPAQGPNFNKSSDSWLARFSNTSGPSEVNWQFGQSGDVPVHGDWDLDGQGEPGLYRNGQWFLRASNTSGAADLTFSFGNPGDFPILAQVDNDPDLEPCVSRLSSARWFCRLSLSGGASEFDFGFGNPGDLVTMADWDGDGQDEPIVFRNGTWFLRGSNTSGPAEASIQFGSPGDAPLVGQMDDDPALEPCVWRAASATTYCRRSFTSGPGDFEFSFGLRNDVMLLGDVDSDGQSEPILGR